MLNAGTRLGSYEILSSLGAGGMGEVYKARDTRLERTVAIKVLPPALAGDAQFRDRFRREARTISQLDHPNVCTLFDVGEEDGASFLVMQYLEGETLEARLKNGAVRFEQALQIAIQVAEALSAAHRSGIVHRDLKPGNVMLIRPGVGSASVPQAKLLDFGLAKTAAPVMTTSGLSMLPTTPPNLTAKGTILGTFHYMAPEQLEGQEADARSDIFAFGLLVYEMLTGRKAFEGRSHASLIGAILKDQPPSLSSVQPLAPLALERVVTTCLAKDPDERWQTARDLLRELKWIAAAPRPQIATSGAGKARRSQSSWLWPAAAITFALSTLALGLWTLYLNRPIEAPPAIGFSIQPPAGSLRFAGSPGGGNTPPMAVSPDGRWIVFSALSETAGRAQLWVRPLDGLSARVLPGAENARYPFWSPDSRSVAYFTQNALMKVDVAGGRAQKIADTDNPTGGTWNRDGTILLGLAGQGLFRLPSTGGELVQVATDPGQNSVARFPLFLPDGRHFLYLSQGGQTDDDAIYVGSLDSPARTRLMSTAHQVRYTAGRLLFLSGETLMSQPFDPEALRLSGAVTSVVEPITSATTGYAAFSVSENGVLVTATGGQNRRQLKWFDRSGKPLEEVKVSGRYSDVHLLPDGRILAVRPEPSGADIWILDPARGTESRLTDGAQAVLSPDGQAIAFQPGPQDRTAGIRRIGLAGSNAADTLLSGRVAWPSDWSPDGRWILFMHPGAQFDVSVLEVTGGGALTPFLHTAAAEGQARFSPDQQWVAYQSDESGVFEIYVRHFPDGGHKAMVSSGGGSVPRWDPSGKAVYYLAADGTLAEAVARADGVRLVFGKPQPLFRLGATLQSNMFQTPYAVSPDRSRFLVSEIIGEQLGPRMDVFVNWPATLRNQMPNR